MTPGQEAEHPRHRRRHRHRCRRWRRRLRQDLRIVALDDFISSLDFGPDFDERRAQAARRRHARGIAFDAGHGHAIAGERTSQGANAHPGMKDPAARVPFQKISSQVLFVLDQSADLLREAVAIVVGEAGTLETLLVCDLLEETEQVAIEKVQADRWTKVCPHCLCMPRYFACRSGSAFDLVRQRFGSPLANAASRAGWLGQRLNIDGSDLLQKSIPAKEREYRSIPAPEAWRSLRDSNPCFSLERATS